MDKPFQAPTSSSASATSGIHAGNSTGVCRNYSSPVQALEGDEGSAEAQAKK